MSYKKCGTIPTLMCWINIYCFGIKNTKIYLLISFFVRVNAKTAKTAKNKNGQTNYRDIENFISRKKTVLTKRPQNIWIMNGNGECIQQTKQMLTKENRIPYSYIMDSNFQRVWPILCVPTTITKTNSIYVNNDIPFR